MAYGVGAVQQPKILSPQEHLANALTLRAKQLEIDQQASETAAKLKADAATAKRQAWLQTAAQTYRHEDGSPDWASITKAAQTYDPAFGLELSDRVGKAQAQEADLHTKELKNNLDSYGMVATLGEHVNDQDSYDRFLKASSQIDPTFQGPPQYDPAFMQQVVQKGYLNADYMKRHLELEKQASEGLIGADKYLGGVLSLAQSQDDVDQAFKGAATRYHLTADQVAQMKQEWGGQFAEGYAEHAGQRSMTANERADNVRATSDPSLQSKDVLLGGKRAIVNFNPKTGTYTPVEGVSPIPPQSASSGVGNAAGERLSPDAIERAGAAFRLLGKDSIPTRLDDVERTRIMNAAAAQSKALGVTPAGGVQKLLATKADQASLTQLRRLQSSSDAAEQKAITQADIVSELSKKVPRTFSPLINKALLSGQRAVLGDPNATLLQNALITFTNEYGKIIEGSTGSVAGASESARKAAEKLASANMNPETLQKTLDLMKREMRATMLGYDGAIEHVMDRVGSATAAGATPAAGGKRDSLGIR